MRRRFTGATLNTLWDTASAHFTLNQINHKIISEKAIQEKIKLENAISSIGTIDGIKNKI